MMQNIPFPPQLIMEPTTGYDATELFPMPPEHRGTKVCLKRVERQGKILRSSSIDPNGGVLSLSHFLYLSKNSGKCRDGLQEEVCQFITSAPAQLEAELNQTLIHPKAVQLCPESDAFPLSLDVQRSTLRLIEILASRGIQTWIVTRGIIRREVLQALKKYREHVKIMVAMNTLDRHLQRVLEPQSATPFLRFKQIQKLKAMGFAVSVAIDPLVPGLTDTKDNLMPMFQMLVEAGVSQVSVGYLGLTSMGAEKLRETLLPHGWDELVLSAFVKGPMMVRKGSEPTRYLPKNVRQKKYAMITALAANYGMKVSVSTLSNPDFARATPVVLPPTQRRLAWRN